MASKKTREEDEEQEQEETRIPVFTVIKNGAILKNIFIVNNNTCSSSKLKEQILIIGRHPDCNVILTHPSISRFHLKIISNPSSQTLSIIDLSSVHGTWVSEKKIEPWIRVEVKEGDSLRIGGSSRVYRLHWIPLSQAHDFETPYVSASEEPMDEDNEDFLAFEAFQDENSVPIENNPDEEEEKTMAVESDEEREDSSLFVDLVGEGLNCSFSDENLEMSGKREIPSAPPIPENLIYSLFDENEEITGSPLKGFGKENEVLSCCEEGTLVTELEQLWLDIDGVSSENEEGTEKPLKDVGQEKEVLSFCGEETLVTESEKLSLAIDGVSLENEEGAENLLKDVGQDKEVPSLATESEMLSLAIDGVSLENEEDTKNPLEDGGQEKEVSSFCDKETLVTELEKLHLDTDGVSSENENSTESPLKDAGQERQVPSFCREGTLVTESEKLPLAGDGVSLENEEDTKNPLKEVSSFYDEETLVTELEKLHLDTDGVSSENENSTESPLKDAGQERQVPSFCREGTLVTESEKLPLAGDGVSSENELLGYDIEAGCENESPEISPRKLENESPLEGNIFGLNRSLEPSLVIEFVCERASPEISSREPENICSFKHGIFPEAVYDVESPSQNAKPENSSVDPKPNLSADFESAYSDKESHLAFEALEETEELKPSTKDDEPSDGSIPESVNSSLPNDDIVPRSATRSDKKPSSGSIWSRRGKLASSIQLQTSQSRVETTLDGVDSEDTRLNDERIFSSVNGKEDEIFTPDKENFTPNSFLAKSQKRVDKLDASDISSTDGQEEEELFNPDKENFTPNTFLVKSSKRKDKLANSQYGKEDEVFTPESENFSPNTFPLKSSKKKGVLSEVKYSKPSRLSPLKVTSCGSTTHLGDDSAEPLRSENRVSRVLQELKPVKKSTSGKKVSLERELLFKRKRLERVPFQSLLEESDGKSRSSPARSSSSASSIRTEEKTIINPVFKNPVQQISRKAWTMVADATTLLNKQSRKYLQLLQGIKQTRLVIPHMVIRELDGMKQRGSMFRKKTEACLVLEWIEQCLVETSSWIHVQSSAEDGRLTAPTPPASPWTSFLGSWSSTEIVSPKTQDHILECALMCRKMNGNRQIVLLSDNVGLKVKAMAEGILCERVREFRESLVNPFSERFLWVESSPRGQTWSFADEIVLREYSRCPLKRQEVSAKGLKLILLHNSHYGQRQRAPFS